MAWTQRLQLHSLMTLTSPTAPKLDSITPYLKNFESVAGGRVPHVDFAVKSARPYKSVIEGVDTVGGPYHQHLVITLEPIHLTQQLQQSLFTLCSTAVRVP